MIDNAFTTQFDKRNTTVTQCGFDNTQLIEYRFNSQGFRSNTDYTNVPGYAFFGSSTVLGVGIDYADLLVNKFPAAQNYGLAGDYLNIHSVINLERFVASPLYQPSVQVIFFWIDRIGRESIPELFERVAALGIENILHISQGQKYSGMTNLMPAIDTDVSQTQPGPKTHALWAKTIGILLDARKTNSN